MIPRTRKGVDIARFCVESGRRGQVKLGTLEKLYDPFTGGGSIPLEAQRLGLEVYASDLNPVAVLLNKALVEIPPKFAGKPPVNPEAHQSLIGSGWHGAQGLAEDIRYYGKWMREEAERRIGHLYPEITLPKEIGGGEATVIAWLWTRTVTCPNPACCTMMPLVSSFYLSKKKSKEVWIEPIVDHSVTPPLIRFSVQTGTGKPQDGTVNRMGAHCIVCATPVSLNYIRIEAKAGRMQLAPLAIVAESQRGRVFLAPIGEHEKVARSAKPEWKPEELVTTPSHDVDRLPMYGMYTWGDAFTPRQLVALTTFNDLVQEARLKVLIGAIISGLTDDSIPIHDGGTGACAYADAIATYLGLAVSRSSNTLCSLALWSESREQSVNVFSRQALAMTWDFPEVNPFAGAAGDFGDITLSVSKIIASVPVRSHATVEQKDATKAPMFVDKVVVTTDPPYYDNVGYADLSDFFYVWLRRSLGKIYPELFSTLLVPKAQELVATPYRFSGNKLSAQRFFEEGLYKTFLYMREVQHTDYPLTIYYAFKQAESDSEINEDNASEKNLAIASTGWETMLEGLINAGFNITGTWPIRTERMARTSSLGTNALASSIVLVCRPRPVDAPIASRRQFLNALRAELPCALKKLQHGSIAPVDLAQASIGPGMAIYSRYSKVVESDGTPLLVRTALQLINRALDEALAEQEGEYDGETRWAIAWFEQYSMNAGEYGIAETLSKAKNTTVQSLADAGFLEAKAGKVRLLKREELPKEWNPKASRLTVWEVMQRIIDALLNGNGEIGAGNILRQASAQGEGARDLAYRLYTVCERKGWAQEALAYNSLVTSWSEISRLAHREADGGLVQATFLG